MTSALLTNGTIVVDEALLDQARDATDHVYDRVVVGLRFVLDDGSEVELPKDLAEFVSRVVQGAARGPVSVRAFPQELTTTTAAELLGVSRTTLMKWVASGVLASHKVGAHTRLSREDVFARASELRAEREQAFADLRVWDESFARAVGVDQ